MLALLGMVRILEKGWLPTHKVATSYVTHRQYINNWDLVDCSAPQILGAHLLNRKRRGVLYKLAASDSLWDRRIAVLSTFAFIKEMDFKDTLLLAEKLVEDKEDLMHKAVGWMLREVGNRDLEPLREFLEEFHTRMPRVMLRYAIEKLSEKERRKWLRK